MAFSTATSASPTTNTNTVAQEDEMYFLRPIIIQVENTLFKVPRYYLTRSSDIFKDMFSIPQGASDEGMSDSNPVKIHGVKKEEFKRLLEVLLPLRVDIPPSFDNIPKNGWIAVLRLAKMWEIYDVRETAITYLDKLRPPLSHSEKIKLAKEYHILNWLHKGYEELVRRPTPLSDEEAEEIGWKSAMAVNRAREQIRSVGSIQVDMVETTVGNVFEAELKEVKAASETYISTAK